MAPDFISISMVFQDDGSAKIKALVQRNPVHGGKHYRLQGEGGGRGESNASLLVPTGQLITC